MMKNWLITIFCLIGFTACLQAQDRNLVQFSGIIYNADTNVVVPYVTIINKTASQTFSANYQGYFSFVAHEGDTIIFSAVGYSREALVIPSGLAEKKYTVIMKMRTDVVSLPAVRVYPWASIDEFNQEFMTMKVADDDLEIAKKNVGRESILAMTRSLPRDGKEIQSLNFQNNHIEMSNRAINQRGANPLFNPFAWGALIQQIMQGDKSRSSD